MKKIALIGGSFNPPTKSHLQIVNICLKYVDEVWFLPCYVTYYNKELISPKTRIKMLKLMLQNLNTTKIKICDFEIRNKLVDETYPNMLKFLQYYNENQFYFVIGMDNANKIHTWGDYKNLINLLPFIIIPRKNYQKNNKIKWYLKKPHILINVQDIEGSSTEVRQDIAKNIKSKYLFDNIYKYILNNKLYKS